MHIEHISKSTVKVVLTADELERAGLSYNDIDSTNPLTVSILLKFIDRSCGSLNRFLSESSLSDLDGRSRLFTEIFPAKDGGCIFYISSSEGSILTENLKSYVIVTDSPEDLLRAAYTIKNRMGANLCSSTLSADEASFKLTADIPSSDSKLKSVLTCRVKLEPADESVMAHINEHCRTVIGENAVEKLSALYSRTNLRKHL